MSIPQNLLFAIIGILIVVVIILATRAPEEIGDEMAIINELMAKNSVLAQQIVAKDDQLQDTMVSLETKIQQLEQCDDNNEAINSELVSIRSVNEKITAELAVVNQKYMECMQNKEGLSSCGICVEEGKGCNTNTNKCVSNTPEYITDSLRSFTSTTFATNLSVLVLPNTAYQVDTSVENLNFYKLIPSEGSDLEVIINYVSKTEFTLTSKETGEPILLGPVSTLQPPASPDNRQSVFKFNKIAWESVGVYSGVIGTVKTQATVYSGTIIEPVMSEASSNLFYVKYPQHRNACDAKYVQEPWYGYLCTHSTLPLR